MIRQILTVAALAALSGCSFVAGQVEQAVKPVALPDAQAALAMAQQYGDTDAAACYQSIVTYLQDSAAPSLPVVNGALSALEAVRIARQHSGDPIVPAEIHRDCAVIIVDAQEVALKLGIRAGAAVVVPPAVLAPKK